MSTRTSKTHIIATASRDGRMYALTTPELPVPQFGTTLETATAAVKAALAHTLGGRSADYVVTIQQRMPEAIAALWVDAQEAQSAATVAAATATNAIRAVIRALRTARYSYPEIAAMMGMTPVELETYVKPRSPKD